MNACPKMRAVDESYAQEGARRMKAEKEEKMERRCAGGGKLTLVMCTPIDRWMPEHRIQIKHPRFHDAHRGPFVGQSAHVWFSGWGRGERKRKNKSKKKQVWRESESRGNVVPILRRYSADAPNGSAWLADYSRNNKLCKNTLPWTPVVIFLGKEKNERKRRRVTNCRRTLANSSPRMTECFSLSFLLPSRSARVVIFHRISFF